MAISYERPYEGLDEVGGGGGEGFVTIATGGTGGVYYILGGGIADLLNEDEELDVDASAEARAEAEWLPPRAGHRREVWPGRCCLRPASGSLQ